MGAEGDQSLPAAEIAGMARIMKRELGRTEAPGSGGGGDAPAEVAWLGTRFDVHECIGRGGMGSVYRARRRSDGLVVAIKVLPESLARDPVFRERMERESEALRRLKHPHIVSIVDFLAVAEGCALVMEYVEGASLRALLEGEAVGFDRALKIVLQIAQALSFAHGAGVVHRDVKPENILLDLDGDVKVVDFGLAKLSVGSAFAYSLTATGASLGTPIYVAPEVCRGAEQVDQRSDIYSLGVILYELLTGQLPLGRFRPPSQERQGVPTMLDAAVLRALENHPDDRFASVSDMIAVLSPSAGHDGDVGGRYRKAIVGALAGAAAVVGLLVSASWYQGESGEKTHRMSEGDVRLVNSLGMRFVAVEGTDVLFSIWETRVSDFQTFVEATGHDAKAGFYSYAEGDEWNRKVHNGDDWEAPGFPQTGDHPVVGVNWHDARAFCRWLTERERASGRLARHQSYRLPEDEEWTRAAGLRGAFPWGPDGLPPHGSGNFAGTEVSELLPAVATISGYDDGYATPSPVGCFPANRFGMFDMAGNVWEWTGSTLNEQGEATFRGASWTNSHLAGYDHGLSNRWQAGLRINDIGFRVVLSEDAHARDTLD